MSAFTRNSPETEARSITIEPKKESAGKCQYEFRTLSIFRHYSDKPIAEVRFTTQNKAASMKPEGLWISPQGCYNWESWSQDEEWSATAQKNSCRKNSLYTYKGIFKFSAKICLLRSAKEVEEFGSKFGSDETRNIFCKNKKIYWRLVASEYQGIIIAPFESLTFEVKDSNPWLFGWDEPSGCVWDPEAIAYFYLERAPKFGNPSNLRLDENKIPKTEVFHDCFDLIAASPAELSIAVFRHFSGNLISEFRAVEQPALTDRKPNGLWLSPQGYFNWEAWTEREEWSTNSMEYVYRVALKPDARICWLRSNEEVIEFSRRFMCADEDCDQDVDLCLQASGKGKVIIGYIWWQAVAREYQGIVIAPLENITVDWSSQGYSWLWGWDMSSGCVWDPEAVSEFYLERHEEGKYWE